MKRNIIIASVILIALTALAIAITYQKKPSDSSKQIAQVKYEESKIETATQKPEAIQTASQGVEKISQYSKEFNLPEDLKEELIEASKEPVAETKEPITEEELQAAGLSKSQLKASALSDTTQNLTAGYTVSEESFNQMLSIELDAETLGDLALLSLAEDKPYQTERALNVLKDKYPDSEITELIKLEYSNYE